MKKMSDLISRQTLIKKLCGDCGNFLRYGEKCERFGCPYNAIIKTIKSQPTAYDVNKVVEQLEERLPFCPTNQTDTRVEYELLEAIEIVKAGVTDEGIH